MDEEFFYLNKVGEVLGVSQSTLRHWRKYGNLICENGKVSQSEINRILKEREESYSYVEAAQILSIHRETLRNWIAEDIVPIIRFHKKKPRLLKIEINKLVEKMNCSMSLNKAGETLKIDSRKLSKIIKDNKILVFEFQNQKRVFDKDFTKIVALNEKISRPKRKGEKEKRKKLYNHILDCGLSLKNTAKEFGISDRTILEWENCGKIKINRTFNRRPIIEFDEIARIKYKIEQKENLKQDLINKGLKVCSLCNKEINISKFVVKDRTVARCRACRIASSKTGSKERYLVRTYNITKEEYDSLLKESNGQCTICQKSVEKFHIDHDHNTGKVRNLLCPQCNHGLGFFKDDIIILKSAISYLERYSNVV